MSKYLYGAAVQGIQGFIFQTNTLKEIVGASELVEDVCTNLFAEQLGKKCGGELKDDVNAIINAAGNVKYIFESEEQCRKVFRDFPKSVLQKAPGITISQAVVEMGDDEENLSDSIRELEYKLRGQRNKPLQSMTLGLMGMQRSRETGLPETRLVGKGQYCDESTYQKIASINKRELWKKATGLDVKEDLDYLAGKLTDNISYFTGDNDWIAVIHADGNGLGKIVRVIGEGGSKNDFREFSSLLDKSTCDAAKSAFASVFKDDSKHIPFRPIVLGGDDLTVIIRGDMAMEFTKNYLKAFGENTKENFKELADKFPEANLVNGLTACAGVAFIKSSFPYYYGYNLADELCSAAKKASDREKSCLMFHKVQDSYVSSFEEIKRRELTTPDGYSFEFGPYFLEDNGDFWSIDSLVGKVEELNDKDGNALKSDIRQWLSAMVQPNGSAKARQLLRRLEVINPKNKVLRELTTLNRNSYPAYDVLSLHSIYYQKTK